MFPFLLKVWTAVEYCDILRTLRRAVLLFFRRVVTIRLGSIPAGCNTIRSPKPSDNRVMCYFLTVFTRV